MSSTIRALGVLLLLAPASIAQAEAGREPVHLQSATALAFGPQGTLFVADPQAAAIVALRPGGAAASGEAAALNVKGFDGKVAAALGTTADRVRINDLAVHPGTHEAWLTVSRFTNAPPRGRGRASRGSGTPVLVRVDAAGGVHVMDAAKLKPARVALSDAPTDRPRDGERRRRRRSQRRESITDMAFVDGRLLVAGLSNEEFASTLRSIPYPFTKAGKGASIEIFHGAHGRLETHAPIRTFTVLNVAGTPQLCAAYTCTPLVTIPMSDLEPGKHVKGRTIAELGNRNRPLDMITYTSGGKQFLLIANSSRGVMKVPTEDFAGAKPVAEHVRGGATAGVAYEKVERWTQVHQLDRLDDARAVVVMRGKSGAFDLVTLALP